MAAFSCLACHGLSLVCQSLQPCCPPLEPADYELRPLQTVSQNKHFLLLHVGAGHFVSVVRIVIKIRSSSEPSSRQIRAENKETNKSD